MKFLVFAEYGSALGEITTKLRDSGEVFGVTLKGEEKKAQGFGIKRLTILSGRAMADNVFKALEVLNFNSFDKIFIGSSPLGREIAGMMAVKLSSPAITEIFEFKINNETITTKRFFFGGKTILEEESKAKVITVQPSAFEAVKVEGEFESETVELGESAIKLINEKEKERSGTNIESASILVAIGRGIGKKESIDLINPLVDAVHGEIAGSRPICLDYKWLSEERQVGLSGKKVKPKVYIALGISGQIQHIAGMRGSKVVVAINKDKDAPIFQECDYGIVGDLFQIVPKLVTELKN
jgi:electron transfer flavoprotein alpha subunit